MPDTTTVTPASDININASSYVDNRQTTGAYCPSPLGDPASNEILDAGSDDDNRQTEVAYKKRTQSAALVSEHSRAACAYAGEFCVLSYSGAVCPAAFALLALCLVDLNSKSLCVFIIYKLDL